MALVHKQITMQEVSDLLVPAIAALRERQRSMGLTDQEVLGCYLVLGGAMMRELNVKLDPEAPISADLSALEAGYINAHKLPRVFKR